MSASAVGVDTSSSAGYAYSATPSRTRARTLPAYSVLAYTRLGSVDTAAQLGNSTATYASYTTGLSEHVRSLIFADDVDGFDAKLAAIQAKLRMGDIVLAAELANLARGVLPVVGLGASERAVAIEALAGALAPELEHVVVTLIRELCASTLEDIQVSAIAAAAHLSKGSKALLRPSADRLARTGSARVRRAAAAFLRES